MQRHKLLVLTIAVVALVSIAKGTNAGPAFNEQLPFAGVIVPNACPPGNPISASGNFHLLVHVTNNANGFHYDLSSNLDNYSAFDTVTGTAYSAHQNGQTNPTCPGPACVKVNGSSTTPQVEFTVDQEAGLESHGSEPNLLFKSKLHVTINSNGDVTASVSDFSLTCQGS